MRGIDVSTCEGVEHNRKTNDGVCCGILGSKGTTNGRSKRRLGRVLISAPATTNRLVTGQSQVGYGQADVLAQPVLGEERVGQLGVLEDEGRATERGAPELESKTAGLERYRQLGYEGPGRRGSMLV